MKWKMICLVLLIGYSLQAQENPVLPDRGFIATSIRLQAWRVQPFMDPISQLSAPMTAVIPIGKKFHLNINHTPAFSWWREDEQDIAGFSDTWVQGSYIMFKGRVMLNLGLGLPTGKTNLDSVQYTFVKDRLSQNIFKYQLPVYSQGLSGKAGFAIALPISAEVILGIGGQYYYRRPYHPVTYQYKFMDKNGQLVNKEWNEPYKPGDEVTANAGLDIQLQENMRLSLDATFTHYWRDLLNAVEIYGSGEKIGFHLGYFYQFNRRYIWYRLAYRQKGKNEILMGLSLAEEEKNSTGAQAEMDLTFKFMDFDNGGVSLFSEGRIYGQNEYGLEDHYAVGFGIGVNYQYTENFLIDVRVKYLTGTIHPYGKREIDSLESYFGFVYEF